VITEPATTITDYLMAALAIGFATSLARAGAACEHARWWSRAFAVLAVSALAGGTYHGFRDALTPWGGEALWRITVATSSLASFALMRAITDQWLGAGRRTAWSRVAIAKLVVALAAGVVHPVFTVVVVDFGISMLFAVGAAAVARAQDRRAFRFLAAGVALFGCGAVIQQAGLSPHPAFNHNDLFHVIQVLGNVCFLLSARFPCPRH